jgi:hypothetical protein
MLFSLQAKLIALVIVATFLAGTHWRAYRTGQEAVRIEWQADIQARTAAALEAEQRARAKETALQVTADKLRRTKDAEITGLTVRVGELNKRLSNRADRPADPPAGAASSPRPSTSGCTGAELYRPDGEFLVREARRAETLRAALRQCYAQYEDARALK